MGRRRVIFSSKATNLRGNDDDVPAALVNLVLRLVVRHQDCLVMVGVVLAQEVGLPRVGRLEVSGLRAGVGEDHCADVAHDRGPLGVGGPQVRNPVLLGGHDRGAERAAEIGLRTHRIRGCGKISIRCNSDGRIKWRNGKCLPDTALLSMAVAAVAGIGVTVTPPKDGGGLLAVSVSLFPFPAAAGSLACFCKKCCLKAASTLVL